MDELAAPDVLPPNAGIDGPRAEDRWEPVALRRGSIDAAVRDLLDRPRSDTDLRRSLVVHPRARPSGTGLAPGIQVSIEVLAPGEEAIPPRRNSCALAVQIRGASTVAINDVARNVVTRDVYSVPPFAVQHHRNTTDSVCVRLVFSNAALLDFLGVHVVDHRAPPLDGFETLDRPDDHRGISPLGDAWHLEYERMIDPPWSAPIAWHWRWDDIAHELGQVVTLDGRYRGRRVCVPYDPSTGVTNGTTATLLASMCVRPAGVVDRPHRHTAAAVNYFMSGEGRSVVGGRHIEWSAGDLVFIAPGWEVHHHASGPDDVYQLAVQDNPLHLAMGSLVWQEDLRERPRLLGAEPGFATNRHLLGTVVPPR